MPRTYSGSQMLSRTSALIAAMLLGLAILMRLQGEALELRPGGVLFAGLGFALLAALIWGATLKMRRLENDKSELGGSYDALLETAPGGIIVSDDKGRILRANARAEEMFGYDPGELAGQPIEALVPESMRQKHASLREDFAGEPKQRRMGLGPDASLRAQRKDGSEFIASISLGPRRTAGGLKITAVIHDITAIVQREIEIERANRALRLISAVNRAMRGTDSQVELLDAICRVVIEVGGYRCAWIGYAENDEHRTVTPVASAGYDNGFLDNAVITWNEDSPYGHGNAGTTLRSGKPLIIRSTANEGRAAPWREALLERGYASAGSFPLNVGDIRGVLVIYAATEDAFGEEECALLEDLAGDISHGLRGFRDGESRTRAETSLRRSEAILDRAQQIAHVGSWEWNLLDNSIYWSGQMYRIFGYEPGEADASKEAVIARTHPDDRERVAEGIRSLAEGEASALEFEHRVLWEDGIVRHVHMVCEAEYRDGRPARIIGSTQDVTTQVQHEIEVQRTNRALRMLTAVTQATREAADETSLLQRACNVVVETGGYSFAWIAGKEHGPEKRAALLAGAGDAAMHARLGSGIVTWDENQERGHGTVGRALRSGQPCIVRDVLTDPLYAPWLDFALEMKFNACASFPLLIDGKIEGALVIYASNDTFGEAECGLLEDLARDIGHAIAALRAEAGRNEAEAALRRNEALLGRAEALSHVGSWEWDMRTQVLQWSEETYRILGFEPYEVEPSKPAWQWRACIPTTAQP